MIQPPRSPSCAHGLNRRERPTCGHIVLRSSGETKLNFEETKTTGNRETKTKLTAEALEFRQGG